MKRETKNDPSETCWHPIFRILPGLIFPVYFVLLLIFYQGHIAYMESSSLFLATESYFREVVFEPGGMTLYCANFLTQFFRYPVLGALLLTAVPLSVYVLFRFIVRRLAIKNSPIFAVWLPVVFSAFFSLEKDIPFSSWLVFPVLASLSVLYMGIRNRKGRVLFSFVGAPFFFFLLPVFGFCMLYLAFWIIEYEQERVFYRPFVIIWIAIILLFPIWSHYCLALIPWNRLYLSGIEDLVYLLFPLSFVLLLAQQNRKPASGFARTFSILLLVGIAVVLVNIRYQQKEEIVLSMDRAAEDGDWDRILELSKGREAYNRQMLFFISVALANRGELSEHLFEYPVAGFSTFYLPRSYNYLNSASGGYVYEYLDFPSGGLLYAFDAAVMAKYDFSFKSLKKLIRFNLEKGNYRLAEKYLNVIEKATLYKSWVKKQRQWMAEHPVDRNPSARYDDEFYIGNRSLIDDYEGILVRQPQNKEACEWLLCSLLLEKDVDRFVEVFLHYYLSQRPTSLPKHYQEALMVAYAQKNQRLSHIQIKFDPELLSQFQKFQKMMQLFKGNVAAEQTMLSPYMQTWWYYYLYTDSDAMTGASTKVGVN